MSLNTTSVNNMLQTFIPILSYYMLNNKTIELDIHESTLLYKFDLQEIHLDGVEGFRTIEFKEIPDTNKIQVHLGGVDVFMGITGSFEALHFIPFDATHVDIKNIDIMFTVESQSPDGIHWALVDTTKLTFDSLKIQMKSDFLQKLVNKVQGTITKLVKDMIPKIEKAIDGEIMALNAMIANEGPMTFVFPLTAVKGDEISLNLTMSSAPDVKKGASLINLYFNGMFVDKDVTASISDITEYPPRLQHVQSEQFWIHQNMVDSLFQDVGDKLFPLTVASPDISAQMLQVFHEVAIYYGTDAKVALDVTLDTSNPKTIGFSTVDGITIGADSPVTATIKMICSNATTVNETAVVLSTDLMMKMNGTMQAFVLYPVIRQVRVQNSKVLEDNIGMYAHDYNLLFSSILQNFANDINIQY
jgi:hypothetical protein